MCHKSSPGRFEAELTALLRSERGLVPQVCNVEGLDPSRIANALSPSTSHQLTPDEHAALIRGGSRLKSEPVTSLRDRFIQALYGAHPEDEAPLDGRWTDEALAASKLVIDTLNSHRDSHVKDLTAGEKQAIRADVMKAQAQLDRLLREIDYQ